MKRAIRYYVKFVCLITKLLLSNQYSIISISLLGYYLTLTFPYVIRLVALVAESSRRKVGYCRRVSKIRGRGNKGKTYLSGKRSRWGEQRAAEREVRSCKTERSKGGRGRH